MSPSRTENDVLSVGVHLGAHREITSALGWKMQTWEAREQATTILRRFLDNGWIVVKSAEHAKGVHLVAAVRNAIKED
jgi:hypothetical protein